MELETVLERSGESSNCLQRGLLGTSSASPGHREHVHCESGARTRQAASTAFCGPSDITSPAVRLLERRDVELDHLQQSVVAVLDRVTGSDPSVTDYILGLPAKCPNCRCEVLEKTLVEPA